MSGIGNAVRASLGGSAVLLVVCAGLATLPALAQTSTAVPFSPVEQIYADLAKLPSDERAKRLEEGARKEGSFTLIHTLRGELGAGHVALFAKRYPWLKVEASTDIGSQDAAERLYAEEVSGRHLTDVVSVGMPDATEMLAKNFVARYPTPAAKAVLPQYARFADPQNRWVLFFWSEHGISYNTNLVSADKAPKDWFDLCDPYFKGSVSFDPAETRFISGIYAIMGEEKAAKWFECMGANQPIIQRGHTQRIELMLAGDHMAQGDNYIYPGFAAKKNNPNVPFGVAFTAPMIASMGGSLINRNTPHPYASALYMDWTVSNESQQYLSDQFRGPVTLKHPYLPEGVPLVDNVDPPKDVAARLLAVWQKNMEKKR